MLLIAHPHDLIRDMKAGDSIVSAKQLSLKLKVTSAATRHGLHGQ